MALIKVGVGGINNNVVTNAQIAVNTITTDDIEDLKVTTAKIAANGVTAAKFNADVISGQTELAAEPADTDEFLVSDAGVLKRLDYSLIKSSPSETLITSSSVDGVSPVNFTGIDATYPKLIVKFRNVYVSTSTTISLRFIQGGGSVETGSYYDRYLNGGDMNSASLRNGNESGGTSMTLSAGTNALYGYVGDLQIFGPGITDRHVKVIGTFVQMPSDTTASIGHTLFGVFRRSITTYGTAITGISIFTGSGTFSGPGKIELYGVN
jgi:hypothetical protein